MEFISPRIFSSFAAWIKSRWEYAVEKNRVVSIEGCIPGLRACFVAESLWNSRDAAYLALWVCNAEDIGQALNEVFRIARRGFTKLRLLLSDSAYHKVVSKYPHKVLSHEILLAKRLR